MSYSLVVTPEAIDDAQISIRGPNDIPVLYSAILSGVDIFITGDKDFADIEIEIPEILSPSEYITRNV